MTPLTHKTSWRFPYLTDKKGYQSLVNYCRSVTSRVSGRRYWRITKMISFTILTTLSSRIRTCFPNLFSPTYDSVVRLRLTTRTITNCIIMMMVRLYFNKPEQRVVSELDEPKLESPRQYRRESVCGRLDVRPDMSNWSVVVHVDV